MSCTAVEATKRAFLVRDRHITDPDVMRRNGAPDPQSLLAPANLDADAARIMGRKSLDIEAVLGFRGRDEMIHRDDLVLLKTLP